MGGTVSVTRGAASWARVSYGVDLTSRGVLVVRAERRRGSIVYTSISNVEAPSPPPAEGTVIAGALTPTDSVIHRIRAPFAAARKARRVFPALLDIELPFPLEDCVHEFLDPRPSADGGTETLAVVARSDSVSKRLAAYQAASWDPELLDVEGLALWTHSLEEAPPATNVESRVVVYVGHDRCVLVVGRGRDILGAHALRAGPSMDMTRYLRAYFELNGESIRWWWCGPGVDREGLRDLSAELTSTWNARCETHNDAGYFLPRALAGRALSGGPLRCNLRVGDLTHATVANRSRQYAVSGAVACLVAGLLLCAVNIGWRLVVSGREATLARRFQDTAQSLVSYPLRARGSAAIEQVRRALGKRRVGMQTIARLFEPSLATTLTEFAAQAGEGKLHCEVIALDNRSVALTGSAGSREACVQMVDFFRARGYDADLRQDKRLGDGRVRFVIAGSEQAP